MRKIIIFLLLGFYSLTLYSQIEIKKIDDSNIRYKASFIEEKNKDWKKIPVLFKLNDLVRKTDVTFKAAVSAENIWFYILVKDNIQFNNQLTGTIYQGDCVQISIDARGDETQRMPKNTRMVFGPDDNALGLAIAKGKPVGIVWTGELSSTFEKTDYSITRDEKNKITLYEVKLPWTKLKTKPFSNPSFGLAVRVVNKDSVNDKGVELNFAHGVDGVPQTGLFEKIGFSGIPTNYSSIACYQSIMWDNPGYIEFNASISNANCQLISAMEDNQLIDSKILNETGKPAFYKIRYTPKQKKALTNVDLFLSDSKKSNLSNQQLEIVQPDALFSKFITLLDSISNSTTNELFKRHLQSIKSLSLTEWARSQIYRQSNPKEMDDVVQYIQEMFFGFQGECGNWDNYVNGKRSLIMSYISKRDQTLQYYVFTLPANWNSETIYPLYVELHGAGNPNPLSGISAYLSSSDSKLDLFGYNDVRSYCQKKGLGYHIAPFGRGNSGYTDIGEIDVWEAISDVEPYYKIDSDRRYLYGFSMGGGGTFLNAIYHPDYWAAIAIYSGAIRKTPFFENTLEHLAYLPKWIWCGEEDGLFSQFTNMKKWFQKQPVKAEFFSAPGTGHSYLAEWQQKGVDWISQYKRKRPLEFTYYCFDSKHTKCWGISAEKDTKSDCIPTIHYLIESNKLIIETKEVKSLKIDTSKEGLQLSGDIIVFWNGIQKYSGPSTGLTQLDL